MPPQTMPRITAAVLARDNQDDIGPCLESVAWADERLVILDDRSADRTEEIARAMGARVVHHPFRNFASSATWACDTPRRLAVYIGTRARHAALGDEIRRRCRRRLRGVVVPRRNGLGTRIRHAGGSPTTSCGCCGWDARYDPARQVHEVVFSTAPRLPRAPLLHENYRTPGPVHRQQRHYTDLDGALSATAACAQALDVPRQPCANSGAVMSLSALP